MADHSTVNGSEIPVYNLKCIDLANPDIHQSAAVLKQVNSQLHIYRAILMLLIHFIKILALFNMKNTFFEIAPPILQYHRFAPKCARLCCLVQACMESGIFYVINHGLSEELMNEFFGQMKKFFALPMDEKKKLFWNQSLRGYRPPAQAVIDNKTQQKG